MYHFQRQTKRFLKKMIKLCSTYLQY